LNQCCAEILQKSFFDSIGHFQTNRRLHRCPSIGPRHGAGVVRQRLRLLGQRMALPLWCRMFANKHLNSTAKIDAVDELRQRDDVHGRCNRGNSRGPLGGWAKIGLCAHTGHSARPTHALLGVARDPPRPRQSAQRAHHRSCRGSSRGRRCSRSPFDRDWTDPARSPRRRSESREAGDILGARAFRSG